MAGSRRPSFLKRQKEQKRLARATEKRDARQARKRAQAEQAESGVEPGEELVSTEPADGVERTDAEEPKPTDGAPEIN
jgi:hypothetical protein